MEPGASCSSLAIPLVDGPPRLLPVLGCSASALYLDAGATVLAVLTRRAVQLPCAVILPSASLTGLAPDGQVRAGDGALRWRSGQRDIRIRVVRRWASARVSAVAPRPERVKELLAAVDAPDVDVASLLGRGPGLTPSGDDILAGYLLARRAFGTPADGLAGQIRQGAPSRTTALSGALLRMAAAGWCIPQVADLISSLGRSRPAPAAIRRLLAVGSSSGPALASGVAAAGTAAALAGTR